MGGDDEDKWFVAGGHSREEAPGRHQQQGRHIGRQHGGRHQPWQQQKVLQLPRDWPPPAPVSVEGGRKTEPWQADGGESSRLLVKREHCGIHQQRGQQQEEAAAAKKAPAGGAIEGGRSAWQPGRVYLRGHHRGAEEGEGPHDDVGVHSPKQADDSTRFSYAAAVEGGKRVVLISLDGTALTKEDPRLLGEAVNTWTLDALAKKEFHNVPEVLDAKPTKLGLEVRVRGSKAAHVVRICAAKVSLRALTAEELEVLERPLRRYSGFIRGDANASLTKEAMQLMVDGQRHLRGIEGRMLVDRLIRTDKGCILWLCLDHEAGDGMARIDSPSTWTLRAG